MALATLVDSGSDRKGWRVSDNLIAMSQAKEVSGQ
jgi:hypothetical protein